MITFCENEQMLAFDELTENIWGRCARSAYLNQRHD